MSAPVAIMGGHIIHTDQLGGGHQGQLVDLRETSGNSLTRSEVLSAQTASSFTNITLGSTPLSMAFDALNQCVYVLSIGSQDVNVSAMNATTNRLIKSISLNPVFGSPNDWKILYNPYSREIEVLTGSTLYLINSSSNSIASTLSIPSYPNDMAINQVNGDTYISYGNGNITVINGTTDTVSVTFSDFSESDGIAFDPGNGELYSSSSATNEIFVVNMSSYKLVSSIIVTNPLILTYSPLKNELYAIGSDVISVVDVSTNSVTKILNSNITGPVGTALDDANGILFVSDKSNTYALSTPKNAVNFTLYGFSGMVYASVSGLYGTVVNSSNNTVTMIRVCETSSAKEVSFVQRGLPPGSTWAVTLGGLKMFTAMGSMTFFELNGSYVYQIALTPGFEVAKSNGVVTVDGSSISETVTFTPFTFAVSFAETGLKSGTMWSVKIEGVYGSSLNIVQSAKTQAISFKLTNGTYLYEVLPTHGYYLNQTSGLVKVSGTNITVLLSWKSEPVDFLMVNFLGVPLIIWLQFVEVAVIVMGTILTGRIVRRFRK